MKWFFSLLLFFFCFFSILAAGEYEVVSRETVLTVDYNDDTLYPKRFRRSDQPIQDNVDVTGLDSVKMMGSGAFTVHQLEKIRDEVDGKLVVVDLRQESHGFVNGSPVSWYGLYNWANLGKSSTEIIDEEQDLLSQIELDSILILYKLISKESDGLEINLEEFFLQVKDVAGEKELVGSLGVDYARFFVTDHRRPSDEEVDRFITFVSELSDDSWVYFHCRGGVGRTTTFMQLLDILKNAKQVALADLVLRQHFLGGKDLFEFPEEDSYKYFYAVERAEFIRNFYLYARENNDGFQTSWSEFKSRTF